MRIEITNREASDMTDILEESLRIGMTELLILNLLKEKDCYGYEIKKMIEERTHNVFSFELVSSIYGPLRRMEKRGMISPYPGKGTGKRVRKYYHIEKVGLDYLEYGRKCGIIVCTEFLNNMKTEEE